MSFPTATLPDPKYLRPSTGPYNPYDVEKDREIYKLCSDGDLAGVIRLVDTGACGPATLNHGLSCAIDHGNVPITEHLLSHGVPFDRTSPMRAADARSLPIFQLLVKHGWDINDPLVHDETALTSILDNDQLVRWFLEHGAHTNSTSIGTDLSLLSVAAGQCSVPIYELLIEYGATQVNGVPLHIAAGAGRGDERVPMMDYLIKAGYDVNAMDKGRKPYLRGTPLHYAIDARSLENVRFLLRHGANPRLDTLEAGTPISWAERQGLDDFVSAMKQIT
ncbi:MAG: hypothetical protein Q9222_007009 [Ikaeria aurantiellina]